METKRITFQRMKHPVGDEYELAEKYYATLSVINDLNLTTREIQLLAFTAIKGTISPRKLKEEFCKKYDSTIATVGNIICKLRKGENGIPPLLIKVKDRVKVTPQIILNFAHHLKLEINLEHGETS